METLPFKGSHSVMVGENAIDPLTPLWRSSSAIIALKLTTRPRRPKSSVVPAGNLQASTGFWEAFYTVLLS